MDTERSSGEANYNIDLAPSSFEGVDQEISLKKITQAQFNYNFNKTAPLPSDGERANQENSYVNSTDQLNNNNNSDLELNDCQCLALNLGIDPDRFSSFYRLSLALVASLAITSSIFLIKLGISLNAAEMASIKFFVQILFCLPFAYLYQENLFGPRESRTLLICRGLTGVVSILACYFSIKMINFADAMLIIYSSPIVTAVVAKFLLKYELKPIQFASLGMGLLGILFVIRPSTLFGSFGQPFETSSSLKFILGICLALVGSVSAGFTYVFIKKLTTKSIHFVVIIFYYAFIGLGASVLLSLLIALLKPSEQLGVRPSVYASQIVSKDISLALLAGLINFIGHICFTLALAKQNANKIVLLRTVDIFIAFALDYLLLSIVPNVFTLLGALLILVGVTVILIYKYTMARKESVDFSTNDIYRI